MKIAFVGLRHMHILMLHRMLRDRDDVEIVAVSEADPATRQALAEGGEVELTHDDYPALLAETECDVVAIGDYYGRRGEIAIAALQAGRHIIVDKPVCTRPDECEQIAALARETGLRVGCQLDLRDRGDVHAARRLIAEGAIGEVHTISFDGQHPLSYGSRPGWYFEEGKHDGKINDIAIHAVDLIPWMTGRSIVEVVAARAWNARLTEVPHFQDGAQMLLRLDNGGGVLGDVSYFASDRGGYGMPQYWRITCRGLGGVIEISLQR